LWLAVPSLALLGACSQPPWPPVVKLGNTVAHNQAVHIVNPDARWEPVPPDLDGQRAALLMRRYLGQAVVQPEQVVTN
jgi:hypothetical protein